MFDVQKRHVHAVVNHVPIGLIVQRKVLKMEIECKRISQTQLIIKIYSADKSVIDAIEKIILVSIPSKNE